VSVMFAILIFPSVLVFLQCYAYVTAMSCGTFCMTVAAEWFVLGPQFNVVSEILCPEVLKWFF